MTFLSGVLRDEGEYDVKHAVVEAIFDVIKFIGEWKEQTPSYLCEDFRFTAILYMLGKCTCLNPQFL